MIDFQGNYWKIAKCIIASPHKTKDIKEKYRIKDVTMYVGGLYCKMFGVWLSNADIYVTHGKFKSNLMLLP